MGALRGYDRRMSLPHGTSPDDLSDEFFGALDAQSLAHPESIKWQHYGEGVIPMWIADMDFPVAPPILRALEDRLTRPLGYPTTDTRLITGLQAKWKGQGLDEVPADGIHFTPSVVPALYAGIHGLTDPGDRVVTMTPIYHPFHLAIQELGREVAAARLREGEARWEIDWDALEQAAQGAKLLMLCHPHNPCGRVWDAEELRRLRDLVLAHDLRVISDELHADLSFTGGPFESFAADPRVRDRTLTVTGPCKAFNTAGLGIGVMFTHDPELLAQVRRRVTGLGGHPSALSFVMWRAALEEGQPWLSGAVEYLRGNRDFLVAFLRERLPWVRLTVPEATYLAWLDLRGHPEAGRIQDFLLEEARVAVHNGPTFAPDQQGAEYQGFVRLNFATSRALLTEALERLARALETRRG